VSSPDVLVVGGGPAGATCARELARAGVAVALLDRAASRAALAGSDTVELLHVYLAGSESREAGEA
jgi:2-polyprenyl-6-methoxyphenol hydroxylase-like FAD-dependent oxidoreductase